MGSYPNIAALPLDVKGLPFRRLLLPVGSPGGSASEFEAQPPSSRRSLGMQMKNLERKAQPFRTSGGIAESLR
jgi:hypothetical protein